jgi:hypothetical protein
MISRITKKLSKFEMQIQKSIFAKELLRKQNYYSGRVSYYLELISKRCYISGLFAYKYLLGRIRVKNFLYKLLDSFEEEHNILFSMIEFKETRDRKEKYLFHKHRISCLIRAKKRLINLSQKKRIDTTPILSEYITTKRYNQKYNINITT